MSAVFVIIGILVYAGPCALAYLIGKQRGYEQGVSDGRKEARPNTDWNIPNPGDWYRK